MDDRNAQAGPGQLSRREPPMTRRAKIVTYSLLGLAGVGIAVLGTGLVILQSQWFKDQVRQRIVSVTERATGGRVEIGSFSYDWRDLTAEVAPFVLHGTEPASAAPLLRADKIQVRLRIISLFEKKVDIASLVFQTPRLNVLVAPDGSTNVPQPKVAVHGRGFVEQLLDLKVQHVELRSGQANYNSWKLPLDAGGENLEVTLRYDAAGPRYLCSISSSGARITSPKLRTPAEFAVEAKIAIDKNSIQLLSGDLVSRGIKLQAAGSLTNLSAPHAEFDLTAALPIADLSKMARLPIEPRGTVDFQGHASAGGGAPYKLTGRLAGKGLGYAHDRIEVSGVALSAHAEVTPAGLRLPDLDLSTPQGRFRGSALVA